MDSSIRFNVSANTAQFQSGMRQVDSVAKSTAAGIKQSFSGIQTMLIGTAALAGLKSMMNDFDKVAKVATRFGASAEEIQRVSVAADLAGTSIDTVARVLTKLSVSASDAATGNKAMAESFAKAGINADKFKNAGLDEQLIQLSEAFNRARGDADATNQIIELMGTRAASQMIPLIDNTAALRAEMQGVSVASDDVVRKIEAANDRITRLGNDTKVTFAGALEFFIELNERMGSILAQGDGLLRLTDGLGKALRGNFLPLFEVLGTSRTISEMEEIELRAQAIAQLTREGLLTGTDSQNSALIAERMEQIRRTLEGTKTIIGDINDDLDKTLAVEKEKTSELERQQRALEAQEESRQKALRSIEQEVALIESRLRGDKAGEARLLEDADFQSALERTGSFEAASNFAATRAAERRAKGLGPAGAGGVGASESELGPTRNESIGEMRGDFRAREAYERAADLESRGMFASADAARRRGDRRRESAMQDARLKDLYDAEYGGAGNFGEAYQNYKESTPMGRLTEKQLDEFNKGMLDMATSPEERKKMEEEMRAKHESKGKGKSAADEIFDLLKKHIPNIDEKLPQTALVYS